MKVRKLIEMLAKENWNAEAQINVGLPSHPSDQIKSVTALTKKGKPIVTLNSFDIFSKAAISKAEKGK